MPRVIVLATDTAGFRSRPYNVRLGPLAFTWPMDALEETIGETLDAVGAALTPAERRPRPLKLALRIEGDDSELAKKEAGYRLRRQVRQLLENPAWLAGGLYFWWRADTEMCGWVRLGGGSIVETDPGVSFGQWDLNLETPYLVARPATHRAGRRLDLADRRTGLVPRDTRGTIYNTDFSTQAIPTEPIVLPGDVTSYVASGNRPVGATTGGPLRFGRRLWRTVAGSDGEVISYLHDPAALPVTADAYVTLDDVGSCRVWDLTPAFVTPPDPTAYSAERDWSPDVYYGWERIYGSAIRGADAPLAIDNGAVRLIWLGPSATQGLALEWYDAGIGAFRREGRILHALNALEASVVEATPERVVVEWRAGEKALRAILQRGWTSVRIESYDDSGGTARIEWAPYVAAATVVAAATPSWVKTLTSSARVVYWATGTTADVNGAATLIAGTGSTAFTRARTVVAQIGSPASSVNDVASWSLVDSRSVPVLLRRAS